MPSQIRVDSEFRSHRREVPGTLARTLPHRRSYLGFTLGLIATVVVALGGLGWWLVQSGIVQVQVSL